MSYNLTTEMKNFVSMPLGGMGMDFGISCIKDQHNKAHPRPPRPSAPSTGLIPKKKRRTNAKGSRAASQKCATVQDLGPPVLTGYGDTIVLSNPFDDAPPKIPQSMIMKARASLGQHMYPCGMDSPTMRGMHQTIPMTNVRSPTTYPSMGNMGPMINHDNNMSHFAPMNQALAIFTSPMNNVMQSLPNGPMIMKNHVKMGQLTNVQTMPVGNLMSGMSSNNCAINGPMSINNASNQTGPNRPSNVSVNNTNNPQGQADLLFNPNNMSNDIGNVERLLNINMNISQTNQMGLSVGPIASIPSKKSGAPYMGHPTNQNGSLKNPNLRRALNTGPKPQSSETIYPADQPMIFNWQNPHAPLIYPCSICHKEVNDNDQGIVCESGCNFWFHRVCLGLSEAAFQLLIHEIYAEWACDNCLRTKNIPVVKFKP